MLYEARQSRIQSTILFLTCNRLKMGVKPGRFGNLDGTKRVWYDNLSAMEGV